MACDETSITESDIPNDQQRNRERSIAFILAQLLELMNPNFQWSYALAVQFETKTASMSERDLALTHESLPGSLAAKSF